MTVDVQRIKEQVLRYSDDIEAIRTQVRKVLVGQDVMLSRLLIALFTGGHVLLEGLPGLAKTTAIKALASAIQCKFNRIQFTPDLLPADLIGTMIYNPREGSFGTRKGPIFANLILADEINRAPSKVQSALLEAMQERQVTIGETTYALEEPFLVLATQNPIEQEGTYPLPEAQVDRFLIKLKIGYPSAADEKRMLETYDRAPAPATRVIGPQDVLALQKLGERVFVAEELVDYILALVQFTRDHSKVYLGASPRAALALMHACKGMALSKGRDYALPDDVRYLAPLVLGHRVIVIPDAELEGTTGAAVVAEALDKVPFKTPKRNA